MPTQSDPPPLKCTHPVPGSLLPSCQSVSSYFVISGLSSAMHTFLFLGELKLKLTVFFRYNFDIVTVNAVTPTVDQSLVGERAEAPPTCPLRASPVSV